MTAARNHRDIPSPNGGQGSAQPSLVPPVSFTALTPLAFLGRAAEVFANKTAILYGDRELSYSEFAAEATRLAHALRASGVRRGDRVAYLCPNIPEMLVANFGVPLTRRAGPGTRLV